MLLIFPSIEIQNNQCARQIRQAAGSPIAYPTDPVKMAVIWRGENARTLHVVDMDGVREGHILNAECICAMVQAVDIPIQVSGGLRTYEEIRDVLALGVYRVVIGTAATREPGLIERLVKEFGTRKIAIGIDSKNGKMWIEGGKVEADITPLEFAMVMKKVGVSRIVFSERNPQTNEHLLPIETLRELAMKTNARLTLWGGVNNYRDLVELQGCEKFGVDSVIIGKPLYENRFPCQALWRLNEQSLSDFGPTRRI
ncbi:MAG: 1-(5-phosphoribosyl)-5-((5-phosphoribosylamino)methylideneamino)imidazole-4-carboxamide isomerase [Ignavibacteriales bacterium]|nr:1-(5-phosphoribosyl)-5-((5-phosphoribosylamino)methylideneamino)imidazole-4-carboxamide isomerase [Ignavibacteriales bacterium]